MLFSKMTRNGQITIPIQVRRKFGICIGDYLQIIVKSDCIVIKPVDKFLYDVKDDNNHSK